MAWPALTAANVLSGSGAKTIGANLYDRDLIAAEMGWTWQAVVVNTTTTLQDEQNAFFRFPEWAVATAVITLTFTAYRDGAVSGNANYRLRGREEGGSWVNGSTLNTAITTSLAPYEVTLAVPASPSWAGVIVELALQGQRPASGTDADWHTGCAHLCANVRVAPV